MAWDIDHYRLLQTHTTRCGDGQFFVPVFVTFDRRLADLMRAKAIDVLIVDRSTKQVESLLVGEYDYRLAVDDCASREAKEAMTNLDAV